MATKIIISNFKGGSNMPKGFTKIDNCILLDTGLSLEAKGLYGILKYLSTIPNFKIAREYVKRVSGYGETAFRRIWKELKESGLLLENKLRDKGKFVYTYTLKEIETKVKTKIKENEPKHIDSDGNVPMDGQVSIDDISEVEKEVPINENLTAVVETTGFTNAEATELLKEANKLVLTTKYNIIYLSIK